MDEVASGRRSPKRSIAGIVAFAVFIAAGAFAWQALRPIMWPETALGPIEGTILWPERTTAALASAQSLADSGDPSVAWRLDPTEVATRFAEFVLGWGSPGSGYTVSTTQEGAAAATVVVSRLPVHCPVLAPGTTASCPPPFAEETLALRQAGTLGETGVWSVASVRASGLDLKLDPGDVIQNGGTIEARWHLPATGEAVEGFAASAGYAIGPGYPCGYGSMNGPDRSDGSKRLDVSPVRSSETSAVPCRRAIRGSRRRSSRVGREAACSSRFPYTRDHRRPPHRRACSTDSRSSRYWSRFQGTSRGQRARQSRRAGLCNARFARRLSDATTRSYAPRFGASPIRESGFSYRQLALPMSTKRPRPGERPTQPLKRRTDRKPPNSPCHG
jgi:hypothetical protein